MNRRQGGCCAPVFVSPYIPVARESVRPTPEPPNSVPGPTCYHHRHWTHPDTSGGTDITKALALWFLVAIATTASGATKVAVVVPDEPYLSWMAKQFEIGTELAYKKLAQGNIDFTFEVVPLPSAPRGEDQ